MNKCRTNYKRLNANFMNKKTKIKKFNYIYKFMKTNNF